MDDLDKELYNRNKERQMYLAEHNNQNALIIFSQAQDYFIHGDFEKAREKVREAIALSPDNAAKYHYLELDIEKLQAEAERITGE